MAIKSYSELITLTTFDERFEYLKIGGSVGVQTFGSKRILNQQFYLSREWKNVRNHVISRDLGNDLAIKGRQIYGKVLVHHINPILPEAFKGDYSIFLNPENLITVSFDTHQAIHYGTEPIGTGVVKRFPNDQCPWKLGGSINGQNYCT